MSGAERVLYVWPDQWIVKKWRYPLNLDFISISVFSPFSPQKLIHSLGLYWTFTKSHFCSSFIHLLLADPSPPPTPPTLCASVFMLFLILNEGQYSVCFCLPDCYHDHCKFESVLKFSTYYFFLPTLCSLYIWQAFLQGNEHTLPEIPDPSFMPLFCLHHPYLLLFKARAVSPVDPAFPPYLLSFQACFSIIHQTFWSPSQIQFLFLLSSPTAGKYLLRSAKTLYTDDIAVLLVIVIKVNHLNIYHRGLIKLP